MGELARWSLEVSRGTDDALRELIATRGGGEEDFARFVEEAVNTAVFRETVREIHERNADIDPDEIQKEIDDAVAEVRSTFWADHRR